MTLPKETIDRLIADKTEEMLNYAGSYPDSYIEGYEAGIKDGATEWAGKADGLIEFIEYVINFPPAMSKSAMSEWVDKVREDALTALAKYKEVGNE